MYVRSDCFALGNGLIIKNDCNSNKNSHSYIGYIYELPDEL